jgi:DNA-directed RNA polymerase subunit RPC12/RpoP
MTTCIHCREASERQSHTGDSACPVCTARAIARGKDFARVRAAGVLDNEYTALVAAAGLTHEQVKAAAEADWMTKRKRAP